MLIPIPTLDVLEQKIQSDFRACFKHSINSMEKKNGKTIALRIFFAMWSLDMYDMYENQVHRTFLKKVCSLAFKICIGPLKKRFSKHNKCTIVSFP